MTNHRRTLINTALLLLLCASLQTRAAAYPSHTSLHTFHTSLMDMEYNHQEQQLEISLQVFSHDLEDILSKRARRKVRLDKTPDAPQLTLAYLQDAVNIKNAAGETKTLAWVGMETKADRVWLYIEIKMPEGINGALLRNRIFFDLLDDQVNLVHLKDEDRKSDLAFKPGDSFKPFFDATKD